MALLVRRHASWVPAGQLFRRHVASIGYPQGRLVVLGTGWGAMSLLRQIDTKQYEVVVISPRNHFVFTPLLAGSAVGTLEHRWFGPRVPLALSLRRRWLTCPAPLASLRRAELSVLEPVRSLRRNITFHLAACTDIDLKKRTLTAQVVAGADKADEPPAKFQLDFDQLVVACGAVSNTFGISGVREHAFFLKEVQDARAIRRRILDCFERASEPDVSEDEARRLLSFAVCGGGPTGVEFAGELYDFIKEDAGRYFPQLQGLARITLFEASDKILGGFDSSLSAYAAKRFARQGIVLRTGVPVAKVEKDLLTLKNGEQHPYGLLVWSTGIGPSDLVNKLAVPKDHGKFVVDDRLRVLDDSGAPIPGLYAMGDCASVKGYHLPATAQVAAQEGTYLAAALNTLARDRAAEVPPFSFRNFGVLAYLGGWTALFDKSQANKDAIRVSGRAAWLLWRSAYLTKTVSWRNKVLIPVYWFVTWVFGRDIGRL